MLDVLDGAISDLLPCLTNWHCQKLPTMVINYLPSWYC